MQTVGLFEAKARLSELCERVRRRGEAIVITKRGQAVARLVPPLTATRAASTWERRNRFVRREGPIRDELALPRRRPEAPRDYLK